MRDNNSIVVASIQQPQQQQQSVTLNAETIQAIAVALADELERRGAVQPQHELRRMMQ